MGLPTVAVRPVPRLAGIHGAGLSSRRADVYQRRVGEFPEYGRRPRDVSVGLVQVSALRCGSDRGRLALAGGAHPPHGAAAADFAAPQAISAQDAGRLLDLSAHLRRGRHAGLHHGGRAGVLFHSGAVPGVAALDARPLLRLSPVDSRRAAACGPVPGREKGRTGEGEKGRKGEGERGRKRERGRSTILPVSPSPPSPLLPFSFFSWPCAGRCRSCSPAWCCSF